jgi:hypothetical protein
MSKFGFDVEAVRLTLVTPTSVVEHPEIADTTLDYALRYADLGWYVIPVRPDKKPVDGYGLNSATKDPAVIRNIWAQHPQAGIAIACERSGLVVLDIDPRNGGRETLARLEAERGVIYSAIASVTQSGGEHRVFKAEPGATYPGTLGPGLDVKHRGYILAEPSRGESGAYAWQGDKNPLKGALPTDAPGLMYGAPRPASELTTTTKPGSVVVAPEVYSEIRAALTAIPPDSEYATWFKVLQGLSRLSDREQAYQIALGWSTRSGKTGHTEAALKDKWRTCMRENYTVNYTSIFFIADSNGRDWRNTPAAALATQSTHPLSFTLAVGSGAGKVTTLEYVFDRFMSTGINIVAGAPGVGKTTLIIPLALATAHLCPTDHPMRPTVRRNVIIITESVTQVQRVIYSLAQWGFTGMSHSDFDERVRLISAQRLDPKLVAEVACEYSTWTYPNKKTDGSYHNALPLVVFDTANSVLELENENDNSEVGRAMAHMKQQFGRFPVIIVAHTSKALGRTETDGLSTRGASAWTGDTQGTYLVFRDGESADSPRVLKTDKVRFPTAYDEVMFELVSHKEQHPNVLGELEDEWFTHSAARPLGRGERKQLKEDNKEVKAMEDWVVLCDDMIDLVRQNPGRSRSYYERLTRAQGGPGHSQERKERAMTSLINDGCLVIEMFEKPKGRSDHGMRVDEDVISATQKSRYGV